METVDEVGHEQMKRKMQKFVNSEVKTAITTVGGYIEDNKLKSMIT